MTIGIHAMQAASSQMISIIPVRDGTSIELIGTWYFDTSEGALLNGDMRFEARQVGSTSNFSSIGSILKYSGDWYNDGFGAKLTWNPPNNSEWEIRATVNYNTSLKSDTTDYITAFASAKGFWDGASRSIATTPKGNLAAVSCHNCYANNVSNPWNTINMIHQAQSHGADLIELDLVQGGGNIYVQHDNGTIRGPKFSDVLSDASFRAGDQILYLEMKTESSNSSVTLAKNILNTLLLFGSDYVRSNRPIVIRTFYNRIQNVRNMQTALEDPAYTAIKPFVKLSVLFEINQSSTTSGFQNLIDQVKSEGFQGVEFRRRTKNLYSLIKYSKAKNLGVNLFTFGEGAEEVSVAALREEVDAFTIERFFADKFPSIAFARRIIQDNNDLLYFNTSTLYSENNAFLYQKSSTTSFVATSNSEPIYLNHGKGEAFYGHAAGFLATSNEYLQTYDGDNSSNSGYLACTVVKFNDLTLSNGETNSFLTKADGAGFTIELHNPAGAAATVLRFGVNVNGQYKYATYPAPLLNTSDSFIITGAYDGNGGVWMFVNNNHSSVTNGSASGGVAHNNTKILLGADPQGNSNQRFFSSVEIQMCNVQNWNESH